MSLDILFLINSFGIKLPKKYKKLISINFELYDTKLIFDSLKENILTLKNINSVLDKMFLILKSMSEKLYKYKIINSKINFENNKYHHAGYNSFITGLCFLSLKYLFRNVDLKTFLKIKFIL